MRNEKHELDMNHLDHVYSQQMKHCISPHIPHWPGVLTVLTLGIYVFACICPTGIGIL